jgi:hypothetical protein
MAFLLEGTRMLSYCRLWVAYVNSFLDIAKVLNVFNASFSAIDTLWNGCDASLFDRSSIWNGYTASEEENARAVVEYKLVVCAEAIIWIYLYGNVVPKVDNGF